MQRLLLLGLNHNTAPLEVRERLAFSPPQHREAIATLRRRFPDAEVVLLSTCNRVEMYFARPVHGFPRVEQVCEFLAEFHKVEQEQFKAHLYQHAEQGAVEHLFSVAASLDSMVLGESQIIGQIREAYETSAQAGGAGALLNPLFQRAIAVGKEVMHDTPLGEGRVSVSGIAVGYAKQIFDHFGDKTVLCIGAGKMAMLALQGFAALNPKQLMVCNRDREKAMAVAGQFNGIGAGLDELDTHLVHADIVITSTGATEPIITRKQFEKLLKARRYRPIFLIDIAVPRDIEPSVGELDHVYLYNLDDLQRAIEQTHLQRGGAVEAAQEIVRRHVEEFLDAQRQRDIGPAIDKLYKRFHEMAAQEVGRTLNRLPNAGEQERAHLEELARRIVNKLLHEPVKNLREGDTQNAPAGHYLTAIERIFRLNEGNGDEPDQRNPSDH